MEAPKCVATVTGRAHADRADPRSMPAPRTYTCDRPTGDWHEIHHDPQRGWWSAMVYEHSGPDVAPIVVSVDPT